MKQRKARPIIFDRAKIIEFWEKTYMEHPPYALVAQKMGCSKATAYQVIQNYLKQKNDLIKGKI